MIVLYLQAPAAIALALSVLMAGVWIVRRTGDSRVAILRKLFIFLRIQGFASVPLRPREGAVI